MFTEPGRLSHSIFQTLCHGMLADYEIILLGSNPLQELEESLGNGGFLVNILMTQ